jgi:Ca-activated chloride channel family protein
MLPLTGGTGFSQDFISPRADSIVRSTEEEPGFSLKKQVNEVNLLFIATRHNKPALGLSRDDVSLLDDNKPPAVISDFRTQDGLAMRVGMLIDTSGSVTPQFRFEQKAASLFLRQVVTHQDDLAFVLGFANHANLVQDFINDPELLGRGVFQLRTGGGTALFDAVREACQKMTQREEHAPVARVLVVLSDGESNSGDFNLQDAISAAQAGDVIIYTISTHFRGDHEQVALGQRVLQDLARQTGGRVLYPEGSHDLAKSFSKISEELRSRYSLSYIPSDFTPDGHYRKIKLEARLAGNKVKVRVRPGYYASIPLPLAPAVPPVENRTASANQ